MTDYKRTDVKLEFTPRMAKVKEIIMPRLLPQGAREGTACNLCSAEDKNPMLDVFLEMPDAPHVIAHAHAIVRSWMVTPVLIYPYEAIVGIPRPRYPLMEHFSWGLNNPGVAYEVEGLTKEEQDKLAHRINPLTWDHAHKMGDVLFGSPENYGVVASDSIFSAGGYQGHTIPNYYTLLERGLDGMLEYIDECEAKNNRDQATRDFYEANRIIVRGMSDWLMLYSDKARELAAAESDAEQKKYYEDIAENCAFVAHNKPVTLYNAVQLMWTLAVWDWCDCVGRTDQYLYPFYKYSMENGDKISVEESVTSIMFKIWEFGAHNITMSGVKPEDGSDATNELSYMFLQVLRSIHDVHPRMCVRIHDGTPADLMNLITTIWSEGMSDPSIVGDACAIKGLTDIGVPIEDARDYATLGCQEIEIPGKSNFGCEDGVFNVAKVFEIAMHGGYSTSHPDKIIGPKTKTFLECETFEELFDSFKTQLEYYTRVFCYMCDRGQELRGANFAKLVKTPFTTGCLEKGIPHDCGGPLYNYGVVETAGVPPTSDSLVAIKKLVFEEKKISKETLWAALKANFEGYEKERQMLLNMAPKFGNDNDEADSMAVRVLDLFWSECGKYKSVRGDVYTGACSLLTGGIGYGRAMGAMPDGRFAGEPLGNTMGPRPGADKNGVTAMLNSVAKLPLHKGVGGTTLNVVLTTKLLSNPALRESIGATVKNYMVNGGQLAQITTANVEDLLDAQEHPERHGDLIVRVGGFSIQFVQLGRDAQDEIISRYNGESA